MDATPNPHFNLNYEPSFKPPFRVGRKQGRAVLDSEGMQVVVFPKGLERYAIQYVDHLNSSHIISRIELEAERETLMNKHREEQKTESEMVHVINGRRYVLAQQRVNSKNERWLKDVISRYRAIIQGEDFVGGFWGIRVLRVLVPEEKFSQFSDYVNNSKPY